MVETNETPNPILVTGSHRSGSTWVGKMISASPSVAYIQEPFKPTVHPGINPRPFPGWYYYVCADNEGGYGEVFSDILKFRYHWSAAWSAGHGLRELIRCGRESARLCAHRWAHRRPLLKDPIALLSCEWLARRFHMDIIVIIRHPAAFVSSLKVKGWLAYIENLLDQPLLMRDYLSPLESEMRNAIQPSRDLIDRASCLWKYLYFVVDQFRRKHPGWIFVRHEDLSQAPLSGFEQLYQQLHLEFTDNVRRHISDFSGAHNPAEKGHATNIRRDSQRNIQAWKKRLTPEEIRRVRQHTEPVASRFYTDQDW